MSDNKPENRTPDSVASEPFCDAQSRERLVQELRTRAERFCEQASLEQIIEATLIIRSLLTTRRLLPEQASNQIH